MLIYYISHKVVYNINIITFSDVFIGLCLGLTIGLVLDNKKNKVKK